jgi:hypothetical protein
MHCKGFLKECFQKFAWAALLRLGCKRGSRETSEKVTEVTRSHQARNSGGLQWRQRQEDRFIIYFRKRRQGRVGVGMSEESLGL